MDRIKDKASLLEFAGTLEQLCQVVADITRIEEEKAKAASEGHHSMIDGLLKEDQACILKLRGLEQQRMRQAQELGFQDLTFRQILEKVDQEQRECLLPLFTKLDSQIHQLSSIRESSERAISLRLREFKQFFAERGFEDNTGNDIHFHDRYV